MTESDIQRSVRVEIESLHNFFVAWFSGGMAQSEKEFETGFTVRFAANFCLIPPAGVVLDLPQLARMIKTGYGKNPQFAIAIRNVTVREIFGNTILATYEEWQRNASASTPPDNARIASVIFFRADDKLQWHHVHETWMPKDAMAAESFDF